MATKAAKSGAPKLKAPKMSASASGTSTPKEDDATTPNSATVIGGSSRPDKAAYDAEQEALKAEIDGIQTKLSAVKDKIGLTSKSGGGDDRRNKLRAELDGIRGQQANGKASRTKTRDQLQALNEAVNKKVKELNAAKAKAPFKTVADIDAHVASLEAKIQSGNMKIAEEKKAINEISQCRRTRRTVESFQKEQESIEADRAAADELRKQLDDPESKAASERYDAIKAELDELKKESDDAYANRNKLFDERNALQAEMDTAYGKKRESAQNYREANDRYWAKVNEDRARRAEKARTERAAQETEKKTAIAERVREEAAAPAFQTQIEDCQTLIDYFSGKTTSATLSTSGALTPKTEIAGVQQLELRKVDGPENGMVARKKKGEDDDESYFVGSGPKGKKGRKGGAKPGAAADSDAASSASSKLSVPMATLTALFSLSIPPPTSSAEVPRVVEDLKTKKAWFEANQDRVTKENVAKAEAEVKRLTGGNASVEAPVANDVQPPNGGGEHPAEPASTPLVTGTESVAVPSSEVVEKLEEVQEQEQEQEEAEEEA